MTNEFIDVPAQIEFPYFPKAGSRQFSKHRVSEIADIRDGLYIRVFFQPLWHNGQMLTFSVERFHGRPYINDGILKHLCIKCSTRGDSGYFFLSDAGVYGTTDYNHYGARLYRYSSKLLREIQKISEMGDYAAWCWWANAEPCEGEYDEFADRVETERTLDRMMEDAHMEDYAWADDDWED